MSGITVIYMTDHDDPRAPLRELGLDDACIKELLEIPSAPFRVTYASPANRRAFNHDTAQRMKTADVVYAVLLSTTDGTAARAEQLAAADGITLAGASIDWQSVNRVAELSRTYADLLNRLDTTEQQCMGLDRNSIRRRDLQQSYEYLDSEIERLDGLLTGIALTKEVS